MDKKKLAKELVMLAKTLVGEENKSYEEKVSEAKNNISKAEDLMEKIEELLEEAKSKASDLDELLDSEFDVGSVSYLVDVLDRFIDNSNQIGSLSETRKWLNDKSNWMPEEE